MKLVALDLDGTLLNRGGTIAEETLSEMHRLYQKGVYIAIATGRPYKDTIRFLTDNGLHPEDGYPYALVCNEREIYFLRCLRQGVFPAAHHPAGDQHRG